MPAAVQKITPFLWFDDKAEEAVKFYGSVFRNSRGGEKGRCGWLKDRYGLSWQIVPTVLGKLMQNPDAGKSEKVMQAIPKMNKLDVEALKRAAA